MPGFFVSNCKSNIKLKNKFQANCLSEEICLRDEVGTVKRNTLNKFLDDKVCVETDHYILVQEGYLLNKRELFLEYGRDNVSSLMITMYELIGETFFSHFRGCFSGALYDKKQKMWIVYTNQVGDNPVFFCHDGSCFAAGSQVNYILDFCCQNRINISFNTDAAYQMLTYGYILTDDTFANEIHRLRGGDYIVVKDEVLTKKTYHRFEYHPERTRNMTENEIIEDIDRLFREAVRLEWEKDNEYGYLHIADLSGGLDSRMNLWVSHSILNQHAAILTYSKAGYLDERIAKSIACYWEDEFYFKSLDDIAYLKDIDENTELLEGLSYYSGITGGKRFLEFLNLKNYGIEHTGMVGDSVLGSFFHHKEDKFKMRITGRESEKLADRLSDPVKNQYKDFSTYEIYLMYSRGFRGACNTHLLRKNYTETGSPFLNVEFMQKCYDISVELRMNHKIYIKWIMQKYPEAGAFIWEKTGGKLGESKIRKITRRVKRKGKRVLLNKIGVTRHITDNMNPLDFWLSKNAAVKKYLDDYEKNGYAYMPADASKSLIQDMKELYRCGNVTEKSLVLTVLAAAKYYFNGNGIRN